MKAKKETMKNIAEFIQLGYVLGLDNLDEALERLQEEIEDLSESEEKELTENNTLEELNFWFMKELEEKGFVTLKDVSDHCAMYGWDKISRSVGKPIVIW